MRNTISSTLRTLLFFLAAGMFLFSCKEDEPERSSEASMTSLTLTVEDTDYAITFTNKEGKITLPYATALPATATVKAVVLSAKAKGIKVGDKIAIPVSGTVTLTVTAEDDKTKGVYTLTVEKVSASKEASITSFKFTLEGNEAMALEVDDRKEITGTINEETKQITFDEQSAYVYLNRLKASFTASAGATVQVGGADQELGVTEQDFSSPVSYVVRAEDGTETTYTVTLTKSKLATIPDVQFRTKLKEFVPAAFTEDQLDITHEALVNNDGELDVRSQTPKVTSVKGVEFFTTLPYFNCSSNALESLNVSKNTALTELYCAENALTSLDVSKNTSLDRLSCSKNALESLDVSSNTALTSLTCGDNSIPSLDVSSNTALTSLNCRTNALESLDVRANTALATLYCNENALDSLDVSANTALANLYCNDNALKSLDVSANTALESLFCRENALDSLDVSKNTALLRLSCTKNDLTFLDVTGMRRVTTLDIGTGTGADNPLATLRVNTATQDRAEISLMKVIRRAALTITTVNDAGTVVCTDYAPPENPGGVGRCNDN